MRHLTTISALVLGLLLIAAPAHADTILDFRGNGDGSGNLQGSGNSNILEGGGDWWQENAGVGVDFTVSALSFTGTGWVRNSTTVTDRTQQFLYGDTTGGNGGLGSVPTNVGYGGQPADNIWYHESVQLDFGSQTVTLVEGDFYNGGHGTSFGSGVDLSVLVDGTTWHYFDLDNPNGMGVALGLTGHTFEFWNNNPLPSSGSYDPYRFYVSTLTVNPVPEPTSMALFALGAGGLAIVRRRRRKLA